MPRRSIGKFCLSRRDRTGRFLRWRGLDQRPEIHPPQNNRRPRKTHLPTPVGACGRKPPWFPGPGRNRSGGGSHRHFLRTEACSARTYAQLAWKNSEPSQEARLGSRRGDTFGVPDGPGRWGSFSRQPTPPHPCSEPLCPFGVSLDGFWF